MKCTNYGGLYYAAFFFPLTYGSLLQESQSLATGDQILRSYESKRYSFVDFVFMGFGVITKLILTFVRNILFSSLPVFVWVRAETILVWV